MRGARGAAAVAVALALVAFATWLLGWSRNLDPLEAVLGRPPLVEVPDLEGLAQPRAVADVESARLEPQVESALSLSLPRGAVILQDPPAGESVREGSTVTIVVSSGLARVTMPDAVGRPIDEVVAPLDEAGVGYLEEPMASEEVAEGLVIEQTPEPGVRVTPGSQIRFVVSTGPDPRAVPPTAGLSPEGAAFALGRAGFAVVEDRRYDDTVPEGTVMGTEPAEGEVRPRDEEITLVVSAGRPPVAVPELVGATQEEAAGRLAAIGLVANVRGGPIEGGTVVVQDPAPGAELLPGAIVTVEVDGG